MDAEQFWADVQVQESEDGTFYPVLVVGIGKDPSQTVRVPLAGTYRLPDDARDAAREAIATMSLEGDMSRSIEDDKRPPQA
ncbi:hypothetical protein CDN99_23825 [Roseateles aquatilis]|uniref:Uncharacterized protein n=1 Tax=Roseateles aquatilis TaxID=431061 RepID=A0A246IX10_9BURK|nr:hypothetical protein [Roseateles aquatilis]OWQ84762.1 hypothetical protein CDN99_23825 [Roseateles aquatilis]